MPRGGKRAGAGKPKGTKHAATISKEQAREALRQIVTARMTELVSAQLDNATGIRHLMMRDPKTGKFERVATTADDPAVAAAQIDAALATGNAFWIYTKDPSVQAFTDLMNRALDKPKEQEITVEVKATQDMSDDELIATAQALLVRAGTDGTRAH